MKLNLLVLRASEPDTLAGFYTSLGLQFVREKHGRGPEHLACATPGALFEIYPETGDLNTRGTRIGFTVENVDRSFAAALAVAGEPLAGPAESPWGRRAIVRDPAGHVVELTQQMV